MSLDEWEDYFERKEDEYWDRVCRGCPEAGNDEWCAGCRKDMRDEDEEEEDDEGED